MNRCASVFAILEWFLNLFLFNKLRRNIFCYKSIQYLQIRKNWSWELLIFAHGGHWGAPLEQQRGKVQPSTAAYFALRGHFCSPSKRLMAQVLFHACSNDRRLLPTLSQPCKLTTKFLTVTYGVGVGSRIIVTDNSKNIWKIWGINY